MHFEFSAEKNYLLIKERGVSFEEVIAILKEKKELGIIKHPNEKKYPHQNIFIVEIGLYIYAVPYVKKNRDTLFLKTIFPSRKLARKYLREVNHEKT